MCVCAHVWRHVVQTRKTTLVMNFILSLYECKWMRKPREVIIWKTDKRANRAINTIVIFHFNNGTQLAEMSGYNGEWREMTREHLWCTFYVLWGTMRPKALHHHYAQCRCTHANAHQHTNRHCIYWQDEKKKTCTATHMRACIDTKPLGY